MDYKGREVGEGRGRGLERAEQREVESVYV